MSDTWEEGARKQAVKNCQAISPWGKWVLGLLWAGYVTKDNIFFLILLFIF